MEKSLPFRPSVRRGAEEGRITHYIYSGAESKWDSWRRANGIRKRKAMGFVAESQRASQRRANRLRGKHQKSEGSAPGGGSLRCPGLGGADGGSTPVPECFILFHGVFHLVATERFISFQPSVSSRCTRVFHLVAPGEPMSGKTGTFSPSVPTAGEGRALLPLRHDALDEYVAREQRGGDDEGAIVLEILLGEEA